MWVRDVGERAREVLREIARTNEMTNHARATHRHHLDRLISIPLQLSVSRPVQSLRGKALKGFCRNIKPFANATGTAACGRGLPGSDKRQCDRRSLEKIY
nr:hypothetical protein [uncultured Rhodoblastus sp.]